MGRRTEFNADANKKKNLSSSDWLNQGQSCFQVLITTQICLLFFFFSFHFFNTWDQKKKKKRASTSTLNTLETIHKSPYKHLMHIFYALRIRLVVLSSWEFLLTLLPPLPHFFFNFFETYNKNFLLWRYFFLSGFLIVSTDRHRILLNPEVCIYPTEGKLSIKM